MYVKVINLKRGHVLVNTKEGIREDLKGERRGKNNAIIFYSQKPHIFPPFKLCCHNDGK